MANILEALSCLWQGLAGDVSLNTFDLADTRKPLLFARTESGSLGWTGGAALSQGMLTQQRLLTY